jgi:cytochrome c-type biogenesis protein CcmH/NrfG
MLEPDQFEGYFLLGQAALEERAFDDAVTLFRRAVELDPQRNEPKLALGMACELAGRYAEAYRVFAELAERNPTDNRVRELLTGVGDAMD